MSRIRVIALSMGMVIALLLAHSASQAQQGQGGQGGPGGNRGRGGPGGFGGGGFRGFDSLISLATRPGVQQELKLTTKQKADVQALSSKIDARRKEQFDRMREQGKGQFGRRGPGAGGDNAGAPRGKGENPPPKAESDDEANGASKSKTANAKGKSTTGKASAKGTRPPSPGGNGGPGADFRAAFQKQQAEDEAELAKILNPTQRTRLSQIQIQQEGPRTFTKPDMQKKMGMNQDQIAQVDEIMRESRDARDEIGRAQRDFFRQAFGGGDNGQGGNQGGAGDNGQRGNRGNRGGFNREAMQAKMQDPQFKSQLESLRKEADTQTDMLNAQIMQQIGSILTKKQKQFYTKLRGPDFDLSKLDRGYDPATAPKEDPAKSKPGSSSKKKTTKKSTRSA